MITYYWKGEEREVEQEVAEKALKEFEDRFLEEQDAEAWQDAKEEGFEEAMRFAGAEYNINLEQFFS